MMQPYEPLQVTPVITRSLVALASAAGLVSRRDFLYQQVLVKLRSQGSKEWEYSIFGSDAPNTIYQVARREVDIAMINPSGMLTAAYRGKGPFKKAIPVRTIAVIPSLDWLGFAVHESTRLTSLADVKSQEYPLHVSLRAQRNHSVHKYIQKVLNVYGFSLTDILKWGGKVSYDEGMPMGEQRVAKVKKGKVNAVFDEALTRFIPLAVDMGMRFLPLEEAVLRQMEEIGFRRSTIRQKDFPMLHADVPALDFSGWPIYTHAKVSAEFIYDFCRALDTFKYMTKLQQPGEQPHALPLEDMCRDTPAGPLDVPLHKGAKDYWRDAGYL